MTHHRTRTLVGVLTAVTALASSAPLATAEPTRTPRTLCEIHQLPAPEGAVASGVSGAGPNGRAMVGHAPRKAESPVVNDAVIWRGDKPAAVEAPGFNQTLVDLNGEGTAVGNSKREAESNYEDSWYYDGTALEWLPGHGKAYAINDSGQVVGQQWVPTDGGPPVSVPLTWAGPTSDPIRLPMMDAGTGAAYDLDDTGNMVGSIGSDAAVWLVGGSPRLLARPEGAPKEAQLEARKINGPWIVGTMSSDQGTEVLRWNKDTGTVEPVPAIEEVTSVNGKGWVVGNGDGQRGVLVKGDEVVWLPGDQDSMYYPTTISTDGRTIGGTAQPRGNPSPVTEQAVTWTCT